MRYLSTKLTRYNELPQVAAIWSSYQDDGFGNLIDTLQYDLRNPYYSPYICNFIGHDYILYRVYLCNYGDH